jgi:hypothetical protein
LGSRRFKKINADYTPSLATLLQNNLHFVACSAVKMENIAPVIELVIA